MNNIEKKQMIAGFIYNKLNYMYCDNCRFDSEIDRKKYEELNGYWACEDCHRKYNGWGISKAVADSLAKEIIKVCNT